METAPVPFDVHGFLDIILNCIQPAVIVTDVEGRILFGSPAVQKVFGIQPHALVGESLSVLFTPEDLTYLYQNLLSMAEREEPFEGQLMLTRKDGSRFFAFTVFRPCVDRSSERGMIVISIQDIDREKRALQALQDMQYDDLVKIASGVAHQLRNPLVSIGGFINRLYKSCRSMAEHDKYYEFILSNLERVERLVKKVETFTLVPRPRFSDVSLSSLIEKALLVHDVEIKRRGIQVTVVAEEVHLRADQDLMIKTFSILIENALDALPDGGSLAFRGGTQGDRCDIHVTDTGSGISPRDLPHIFNPFFSTKARGAGIDLATAKRIVDIHSGRIEAASRPGEGTTFLLAFPLERRRAIRIAHLGPDGAPRHP